jgi:O-antigen/teichoic acid export membrane protein
MKHLRLQERPASVLVAGRTIGYVAAFAIPIVLARLFDQTQFGIYKQLFLIFGTLYILAQVGVAESLYYFIPRKPDEAGRHVFNALATLALGGLGCFLLLGLASTRVAAALTTPELAEYVPLLGVFLALMLMSSLFEIALVSRKEYLTAAWTYAVSDAVRMSLIVLPVVAFGGVRWVLIGAIVFAALRLAVMLRMLWQEFGSTLRPNVRLWRVQLAYALPFALAVAVEVVQMNFHHYVVASQFDAATFAIYAVGCLQIPLVDVISSSSANVMMVRMSGETGERHGAAALEVWHATIWRLAFLLFPVTVFLLLAARDVITILFTANYLASVPIFMLWTLTILPAVFCVDAVLRVHAQTRFMFAMNMLRLVMVAGLIGWFLSEFGLAGAVLVMLVSTAVARVLGIIRIARLMEVGIVDVLPWERLASTAACALAAGVPAYWVMASTGLPRLLTLAAAAAAYGLTYLVLSDVSSRWTRATAPVSFHRRLAAWLTEG